MTPTLVRCPTDGGPTTALGDGRLECLRCGEIHDAAEVVTCG